MIDYCTQLKTYQIKLDDLAETIKELKKLAKCDSNPITNIDILISDLRQQKKLITKEYKLLYAEYCEAADYLAKISY